MPNVLVYQELFQKQLQKQYLIGSTTGWMEGNATGVKYTGGKYVYMPEISTDGLGDYNRELGFPRGSVANARKQYELTKDRGREFLIDSQDVDETGYVVTIANILSTFQAEHVVPEIDAYRYSEIYKQVLAKKAANINEDALTSSKLADALVDDISTLQDTIGSTVPLTINLSGKVSKYLTTNFLRNLNMGDFKRGDISTKVRILDGNPIVEVPSARMKTAYTFYNGTSEGQTDGGFVTAVGAGDMNWIIMPVTAPIAIAKVDKVRIFSPEVYQNADAWKTDYRLYHDLWMTEKACSATIINTGAITVG